MLLGADPYRNPDSTKQTVQGLLDRAAEQTGELEGQPEVQTQMFAIIGRTFQRMGLDTKALPLLQRAVALGRRSLGPEHVQLAQSLNNLGVLHREMGHAAQAEPLLREAVEMRRHVLGARHPDVAITLVELSRALSEQGRLAEAEPLSREALAIRREVFGDEHRETATSKRDLGLSLMRRGDLAGAEPLLRENVETTVRLLGPAHPNSASAMATLAQLLDAKGDPGRRRAARPRGGRGEPPHLRARRRGVRAAAVHTVGYARAPGPPRRGRARLRRLPAHRPDRSWAPITR